MQKIGAPIVSPRVTRSVKKCVSTSQRSSPRTPKASRAETPPGPQARSRRTPRNTAVVTSTNARRSQTLLSPETGIGYSPTGNASFSSHPQLAIELDRRVVVGEPRAYCPDFAKRDSIVRRTFVSLSLAESEESEDDDDVDDDERAPNVVAHVSTQKEVQPLELKACAYLASSSKEDILHELLTSLAQVQSPPSIHMMLAPFRDVSRVTTKARLSMRPSSSPQLHDVLGIITKCLLQNISIVTPASSRQQLQDLCVSKRGSKRNDQMYELLDFLIHCDAIVRMMLLR